MGGYGSGRPRQKQQTCEYWSLNVNAMQRSGVLEDGSKGSWQWTQDAEVCATINFQTIEGRLVLDYRVRLYGGEWEPITQHITLIPVPCHMGGHRTYFQCSGIVNGRACLRQVCKLFAGGHYFLCRHCHNLTYASQSEDRASRMLRRANKVRMALGGEAGMANWIAPKPKGMWNRTYLAKVNQIIWAERQADLAFISRYEGRFDLTEIAAMFD